MKKNFAIIEILITTSGKVCAGLIFFMMVLILYEAFMRYIFNYSPMLSDEITSYMLVFLAFGGLAYTWKERGHVVIDILISRVSKSAARRLRILTLILALACSIMLTKLGVDFIAQAVNMHICSDSWLRVPQQWPRAFVPFGFMLLSIQLIQELVKIFKTPEK